MSTRLLLIISTLLVATSFAATSFSAHVVVRHPFLKGGFVEADMYYSWNGRSIAYSYTNQGYTEVQDFNAERGYQAILGTVNAANKPFLDQWTYKFGKNCACETGPVNFAMPILFTDTGAGIPTGMYLAPTGAVNVAGKSCQKYARVANSPSPVTELYLAGDGSVCKAVFDDLRELTFTNFVAGEPVASRFDAPSDCKCGKPMDMSIVLDRSGSIAKTEFLDQKGFVQGFSEKFQYGPLNAALSLVHFNTPAWTTLTQTEGTNPDNVVNGVNDLHCCFENDPKESSCCCCGTSISSGIRMGVDQLKSGRANAAKVLFVVSDGYHNHDINGKDCSDDAAVCRTDLSNAVAYAKQQIPGITIYSIGVGADRDISADEMLIIADNHPERILRRDDFNALSTDFLELVALSCQENINPCGGCCGFCVCGKCQAPDGCDAENFCEVNEVSGVCCTKSPRKCDNPADLCQSYGCDPTLGANGECTSTPIPCKANTNCFTYACEPTTGVCKSTLLCTDVPECINDDECNDQNSCTIDKCVNNFCQWTDVPCDTLGDKCSEVVCLPDSGCAVNPFPEDFCDDQNVCTVDRCDPVLGCVHEPITCADEDLCTVDTCDPFLGCLFTPMICPTPPAKNKKTCYVSFCDEGVCGNRPVKCGTDPAAIVGGTLTAAAIVGIIIGAVLCVACAAGGGAYAYTQAAGSSAVAPVANNPIYVGSGSQGTNPLYTVDR